jgi:hypothetical protein
VPVNPFTESSSVAPDAGSASDSHGWVMIDGILHAVVPDGKKDLFKDSDGELNENVEGTGSNSTE